MAANHPWKTDNWFVSQWNYADQVRKDFKFAKQIKIHDITLRDGEQQTGIILSKDDKIRIAEALAWRASRMTTNCPWRNHGGLLVVKPASGVPELDREAR